MSTLDLFEIVANEADGLVIDPDASDPIALSRDEVGAWLSNPRTSQQPGD